jgi:hypothetical protein
VNTIPRERFTDCERERPDGARHRDPAQRELPASVVIALDQCDEFPEELVRRNCGEELDVQLSDVLGDDPVLLATNPPRPGDVASFNSALCGLWAAAHGAGVEPATAEDVALRPGANAQQTASPRREAAASPSAAAPAPATIGRDALAPIRAAMGS